MIALIFFSIGFASATYIFNAQATSANVHLAEYFTKEALDGKCSKFSIDIARRFCYIFNITRYNVLFGRERLSRICEEINNIDVCISGDIKINECDADIKLLRYMDFIYNRAFPLENETEEWWWNDAECCGVVNGK